MLRHRLCKVRGNKSTYCQNWCLLRCNTINKVNKNNVLAKNGSNMSEKMRFAYNIRGNFKSAGRANIGGTCN